MGRNPESLVSISLRNLVAGIVGVCILSAAIGSGVTLLAKTGPSGPRGPVGAQGLRGLPGVEGREGERGARGAQGPEGSEGEGSQSNSSLESLESEVEQLRGEVANLESACEDSGASNC